MFSGIVEECATLVALVKEQENVHFTFKCSFVNELKIDQSVSHNGVCLTVVSMTEDTYTVTAMKETLERSNLGLLNVGDKVNVERSMMMNGRLDGHIVQGHVDQTATCISVEDAEGSYYFTFRYAFDKEMAKRGYITVDKGSVTVNGVSLTVCNPTDDTFQVAIIPYTFEYTNFHDIKVDSVVNIEFDIIGKYISRMLQLNNSSPQITQIVQKYYPFIISVYSCNLWCNKNIYQMDFLQLVASRQSDRAYDMTRPVEPEKLERILEAARLAPSACNAQPWKFVVINDPELSVKVGKATAGLGMNKFAKDAPVHILVVEESMNVTSFLGAKIKDKYFPLIDIGIATAHITLAAESEGLGSCILGWFDEKEIKKLTGIPSSKRLLLVITIGYSVKEKRKKARKPKEKVVSYNKY